MLMPRAPCLSINCFIATYMTADFWISSRFGSTTSWACFVQRSANDSACPASAAAYAADSSSKAIGSNWTPSDLVRSFAERIAAPAAADDQEFGLTQFAQRLVEIGRGHFVFVARPVRRGRRSFVSRRTKRRHDIGGVLAGFQQREFAHRGDEVLIVRRTDPVDRFAGRHDLRQLRQEQTRAPEQIVHHQRRFARCTQLDNVVSPPQALDADQVAIHFAVALQNLGGVLRIVHHPSRQQLDVGTALGQHLQQPIAACVEIVADVGPDRLVVRRFAEHRAGSSACRQTIPPLDPRSAAAKRLRRRSRRTRHSRTEIDGGNKRQGESRDSWWAPLPVGEGISLGWPKPGDAGR